MKVICGGWRTGKTMELIKLAAEAEARGEISYIVCHNHAEAYRIAQEAKRLDLLIGFPITYDEFLNHDYAGNNIKHLFIDNVEMLLQKLARSPVSAVTILRSEEV
jgi:hypothetical protein